MDSVHEQKKKQIANDALERTFDQLFMCVVFSIQATGYNVAHVIENLKKSHLDDKALNVLFRHFKGIVEGPAQRTVDEIVLLNRWIAAKLELAVNRMNHDRLVEAMNDNVAHLDKVSEDEHTLSTEVERFAMISLAPVKEEEHGDDDDESDE